MATTKTNDDKQPTKTLALADDPPVVVGLQASFSISETVITLNTQDVSKLKDGIQFQLAEPAELGSLADFLKWAAKEISGFPAVDTASWPAPFNGLAAMIVTINEFCVNTTVTPSVYTIDVLIKADPANKPVIPILNITIEGFGMKVSKGDCKKSIEPDKE